MTTSEMLDQLFLTGLEFLKKQALAVVILLLCVVGLIWNTKHQEDVTDKKLGILEASQEAKQKKCENQHNTDMATITDLSVRLAIVTAQVNILTDRRLTSRH